MRLLVLCHLSLLLSLQALAGPLSVETIPYEDLDKHSIQDAQIDKITAQSKSHVLKSAEGQIEAKELELLDVELVVETASPSASPTPSTQGQVHCANCTTPSVALKEPLQNPAIQALATPVPKKKHFIYVTWGYNRGFHSKSDATFKTASGTFTIHDAVGHDRPSTDPLTYINPTTWSVPQYNLKVGYEVNENWDIVAGMDHMKWVFQNDRKYEITGDYNKTLFVPHPNGNPDDLQALTFAQAKAAGDARWLSFDHTNGYNYAHLGAVYKKELWRSKNERFSLGVGGGAGAGLMIPQTSVRFHQDRPWNWEAVDNNFHIAGYGGHADAHLRLGVGNFFLQPAVRGTMIKVDNALVNSRGDRLEHTPIGSIQFILEGGYKIPLNQRKKKSPPKP
jgi:hypothetical protein